MALGGELGMVAGHDVEAQRLRVIQEGAVIPVGTPAQGVVQSDAVGPERGHDLQIVAPLGPPLLSVAHLHLVFRGEAVAAAGAVRARQGAIRDALDRLQGGVRKPSRGRGCRGRGLSRCAGGRPYRRRRRRRPRRRRPRRRRGQCHEAGPPLRVRDVLGSEAEGRGDLGGVVRRQALHFGSSQGVETQVLQLRRPLQRHLCRARYDEPSPEDGGQKLCHGEE
mmetsp:Transcript_72846/g.205241  ORF Transcript_72846/g.205241 Transcript_72846/m.205241 type:complete len:222 (+) Transcript_72846:637-1302(+)